MKTLCSRRLIIINISLNENQEVQKILASQKIKDTIPYTAALLAKYYLHEEGLTPSATYKKLDTFFKDNSEDYKESKWYSYFDRLILKSKKYPLVQIGALPVYQSEIAVIQKHIPRLQRVLFTSLCFAKYYNAINANNNNWVNTDYKNIFLGADIRTTKEMQCRYIGSMLQAGLISLSKKVDNLNYRVEFLAHDGEVAMEITDLDNLGLQYQLFQKDKSVLRCSCCGQLFKDSSLKKRKGGGRKRKYCDVCRKDKLLKRYIKYYNSKSGK